MSDCPLSPKQIAVIKWLAEGKTVRDITEISGRSKNTINRQIANAFAATGTPNATALVATAIRKGWIQ